MHSAALAEMGLGEWSYEAIEVSPEGFEELVRSLPEQGFAGVNVTVPHKLSALAVADETTDAARGIGAANTLTFAGGRIHAENTDAIAIVAALPRPPEGMRALVMGAGGSGRAAVWALQHAGADVNVWNRTGEKAEALARELGVGLDTNAPDILVNATTVGLAGANETAPEAERGQSDLKPFTPLTDGLKAEVVMDLVYGSRDTDLIVAARAAGATVVDGLEILARQGAASLEIWTGTEPPLDTMRRVARGSR